MNKQAAEKIASDYYTVGVQLALQEAGMTKTAKVNKKVLQALGLTTGVGAGALGVRQGLNMRNAAAKVQAAKELARVRAPQIENMKIEAARAQHAAVEQAEAAQRALQKSVDDVNPNFLSELLSPIGATSNRGNAKRHASELSDWVKSMARSKNIEDAGRAAREQMFNTRHLEQQGFRKALVDAMQIQKSHAPVNTGSGFPGFGSISPISISNRAKGLELPADLQALLNQTVYP